MINLEYGNARQNIEFFAGIYKDYHRFLKRNKDNIFGYISLNIDPTFFIKLEKTRKR